MNKLKEKRDLAGYSQKEFADFLKLPLSSYNQYENGNRQIPKEVVDKICEKLAVDSNEIFLPNRFTLSK